MNSQFSENTLGERKIGRFKDLSYFKKARLNLATGLATLKWSKGDKAWSGNRVNKSDPHRLPIATCKDFLLMSWSPCLGVMERFGGLWRTSSLLGRGGLPVLAHHRASHYSKKLKLQLYRHKSVTTDWMKHKCTTCPRKWIFFNLISGDVCSQKVVIFVQGDNRRCNTLIRSIQGLEKKRLSFKLICDSR